MSTSWIDSNSDLWLFGGYGFDSEGSGHLNDLWKYNIESGYWTWVLGDTLGNQAGIYGIKGIASQSNIPGARRLSTLNVDSNGEVWLFGGRGYDSENNTGYLNDLWKFSCYI